MKYSIIFYNYDYDLEEIIISADSEEEALYNAGIPNTEVFSIEELDEADSDENEEEEVEWDDREDIHMEHSRWFDED